MPKKPLKTFKAKIRQSHDMVVCVECDNVREAIEKINREDFKCLEEQEGKSTEILNINQVENPDLQNEARVEFNVPVRMVGLLNLKKE